MIKIYTDGSCLTNPGNGGWAAIINVDNKITLKNVPDLEPFMVKIKGPLDKPGNTFGKNILL